MSKLRESLNQQNFEQNKVQQQGFERHTQNIDSVVRPIIELVQSKIETDFRAMHNKYLLQGYHRKMNCYQKFLKPQIAANVQPPKKSKISKKQSKPVQTVPTPLETTQPFKPSSDQVLDYYKCFDDEINTANFRYQKIYKKSEDNKMKLINCIEKCSGNSKERNQLFQSCANKCKQSYIQIINKLYTNFYAKFLNKD